jgi:hypothetical protein
MSKFIVSAQAAAALLQPHCHHYLERLAKKLEIEIEGEDPVDYLKYAMQSVLDDISLENAKARVARLERETP